MTGRSGTTRWPTLSASLFIGFVLLVLLYPAGCRRQPSLDGTTRQADLAALFSRAEAWGPVELLDLGTGEHKLNLLDGLYFAEREPDGRTYAWSWGDESSFLLTCPAVRPRTLAICCRRLGVEALEDLLVEVFLNGNLVGTFAPGLEYVDHRLETPAGVWKEGDNHLALRYSEDVYLPDVIPGNTDTRRVAVQLDAIRIISGTEQDGEMMAVNATDDRVELPLPADVSWYVQVPEGGLLVFGGESDGAALLRVTAATDDEPATEIFRRRFRAGELRNQVILDLAWWAGRSVRLTFSVDRTGGTGDAPGQKFQLLRPEIRAPEPMPQRASGEPETGSAAPAGGRRPNVLVYVMDALRAGNLTAHGYQRRTSPVLDRLSRRGLLFRNAFAQAPNTTPSVKSLFTGRFLPFTGHANLPPDYPTLAEVFAGSGFVTGLFSNNPNLGPQMGYHRGFNHVAREIFFRRQPVKDFARQATDAFIRWAGSLPPAKPFFAYVHTIHPHNPYEAPFPFDQAFLAGDQREKTEDLSTEALLDFAHGERPMGAGTVERMRDFYDGDILYNDLELGRLLAWLREAGSDRDTVIIFTADHGEELADHDGLLHGYTLYDEQIHVPLILIPPAGGPGRVIADDVRLVDLAPTIFEMSGIREVPPLEGDSLTGFISGGTDDSEGDRTVYSSASAAVGLYTLRTGKWKYIFAPRTRHLWGMGQGLGRTRELHYLFDLENDPGEKVNLASSRQITRKGLQTRLLEWIDSQSRLNEASEDQGGMPELDEETRQRLRDLGYMME
jgi:arylsulfatase A-like enzyme